MNKTFLLAGLLLSVSGQCIAMDDESNRALVKMGVNYAINEMTQSGIAARLAELSGESESEVINIQRESMEVCFSRFKPSELESEVFDSKFDACVRKEVSDRYSVSLAKFDEWVKIIENEEDRYLTELDKIEKEMEQVSLELELLSQASTVDQDKYDALLEKHEKLAIKLFIQVEKDSQQAQ